MVTETMTAASCLAWAALACGLLCACGGGKQDAAVILDEARLGVSSARKAGAATASPARLAEAVTALSEAERSFTRQNYSESNDSARKTLVAALQAETEAHAMKLPAHVRRPRSAE